MMVMHLCGRVKVKRIMEELGEAREKGIKRGERKKCV